MKQFKPPLIQAAFTLLELILVVAVIAILATYIAARTDSSTSYQQDSVVEQIISAGRLTQQLSMNDSARTFSLSIQASQIDLLVDGSSFSSGSVSYPLNFGSNVTLSPVTAINFDNLGMTTATTITVQMTNNIQICFEASGYIRRC